MVTWNNLDTLTSYAKLKDLKDHVDIKEAMAGENGAKRVAECTKSDLVHAVSIVSKAVSNNTTLPILKCILIEASTGNIKLTANDMELGIETTIDGQIHQPGKIAIEAKLFSEIVRKLPDNDITIETDDQYKATITCENACFQIMGQEG